jgi:hypothetical protein
MLWRTTEFEGPLAAVCRDTDATLRPARDALPVPSAADRDFWESSAVDAAGAGRIIEAAGRERGAPWPERLASGAARIHRDGDRDAYEQRVFALQHRVSRAAVAAALTLDPAAIDEVADGVWLLCEQSSWCWPAHDDTRPRHGSVLPTVDDPHLDLGAGEVVGQLAWIDHLLGDALDERYPGLRARIRREAQHRVLTPFLVRRDWHWLGIDGRVHNWNPWIHGNVLTAALVLVDDDTQREELVTLAAQGIDRYAAVLPADGAIDEGYAYWWNGACRALEALDLLAYATAGAWDPVPRVAALRETIAFPHRMHLGGDWYVNLADGPARPSSDQPWHALHRAAAIVGDDDARAHAASHRHPGVPAATEATGLGRLLRGLTDPAWLGAAASPAPLPRDVWLPSTQVRLARSAGGSVDGLALVVKGGHNGENHNHNDVGSIIVASGGVPVVVDAGRPTYTAQTFGPDRYALWMMQSDWHSVPTIAGASQAAGGEFAASEVHPLEDPDGLALSLEGAYPAVVPGLTWHREAVLDRDAHRVVIEDAWSQPTTATSVSLVLAGEVTLEAGGARVAPLDSAPAVRLRWDSGIAPIVEVRELDDPMLSDVWGARLTRVRLPLDGRRDVRVTIEQE